MIQTGKDNRRCVQCGVELAADSTTELCPKCLLQAGLATQPASGPDGPLPLPGTETMARGLPQPGEQLGHYAIHGLLGVGGMGAVYEAEDLENGRRVALKVLGHTLDSPEARARFFREGRLAASINHANSVYVFGTEEIGGIPVIAMELVTGGTLQQRVRAEGPMRIKEAVDCILQVIAGLEAAQRIGILHRDVKPSNCFLATDGTTKIGDFGLSISTAVRTEPALTVTGAFLGTPAFCSPEQLRGDELNARSDMYSVGATLFYLLTGRTAFEGKNVVQLLATVLEKRAPSPREFRPEIPRGLAKVILRCLEKQSGERFRSYGELRKALAPYGATAPTPATLGLRFVAGALDLLILSSVNIVLLLALGFHSPFEFLEETSRGSQRALLLWMLLGVGDGIIYFTLLEAIRGASLGKSLCRLRVVSPDSNPPGLLRSMVRALIYVVAPPLPYWLVFGLDPKGVLGSPMWLQWLLGLGFYLVLGLLFSTARRHNGFAAVHDLVTHTRVVSRIAVPARAALPAGETPPPPAENAPVLGPYHLLDTLEDSPEQKWFLGYDLRLLRKVWIRRLQPGAGPVPVPLRNLGRTGRLRWLAGRRSPTENWDAYEALSGEPLLRLVRKAQPWSQVRFWLHDLASEISVSEKDGTLPQLGLDRVWITGEGQAKLLDFPAPGLSGAATPSQHSPPAGPPKEDYLPPLIPGPGEQQTHARFLSHLAKTALEGQVAAESDNEKVAAVPLPAHARKFLNGLAATANLDTVLDALKPLLSRAASVSRWRRTAVVLGCIAVPALASISSYFGMNMMAQWNRSNPGILELNQVLQTRWTFTRWARHQPHPTDQQFAIYIASHYKNIITNENSWTSPLTLTLIKGEARRFAEQSVADYPSPSAEQVAQANAALKPYQPNMEMFNVKRVPWIVDIVPAVSLLAYVCLPALLAALLFRGGLVLLIAGIVFVRKDGRRASRWRVFWRALIAWSPVALGFVLLLLLRGALGMAGATLIGWAVVGTLTAISLWQPDRGLPDRLAGTWPVPR